MLANPAPLVVPPLVLRMSCSLTLPTPSPDCPCSLDSDDDDDIEIMRVCKTRVSGPARSC